ncbi:uncharacterized protein DS421_18g627870 [Arachis hypogaea]|nr:uncharacterized protein DS421_18g627870 [Arachis hypogaea]
MFTSSSFADANFLCKLTYSTSAKLSLQIRQFSEGLECVMMDVEMGAQLVPWVIT